MTAKQDRQLELLRVRVATILWQEWDPIGVNDGENTCDDEYQAYVPSLVSLLLDGADEHAIAHHLSTLTRVSMGLSSSIQQDRIVAKSLLVTKHEVYGS